MGQSGRKRDGQKARLFAFSRRFRQVIAFFRTSAYGAPRFLDITGPCATDGAILLPGEMPTGKSRSLALLGMTV
jgi:hypothetical protein